MTGAAEVRAPAGLRGSLRRPPFVSSIITLMRIRSQFSASDEMVGSIMWSWALHADLVIGENPAAFVPRFPEADRERVLARDSC
jgi:hypothetical protein